jgi:putative ABC transport system substrate-binding protein
VKRREFIAAFGGAAATWPLAARAQPAVPEIGFLNIGSAPAFAGFLAAFHQGLNATGYVEGKNVAIEYRWANGDFNLLHAQSADLVRRRVALIVATGGLVVARAAKDMTTTIPVLFVGGGYPVEQGLVASLNQPGGNATGFSLYSAELISKRLELSRELVPEGPKFAALLNPQTPSAEFERRDLELAGRAKGLSLSILGAGTEVDLQKAFDFAAADGVRTIVVSNDGFFTSRRGQIVALAASHRLPAIYGTREFVVAGGLMSYGASITEAYRQIGDYTGRVLKGAKPGDLPVQLPTKYELVINLKTAKALGLDIPPLLLARVDEVIE